jgi:hypothetical protein
MEATGFSKTFTSYNAVVFMISFVFTVVQLGSLLSKVTIGTHDEKRCLGPSGASVPTKSELPRYRLRLS